jgi:agmatinase
MTFGDEPRLNLPFTGFASFLRTPICDDLTKLDADVAVLGVPFDEGTTWKPGSRLAPRRIREMAVRFASLGVSRAAGYYDMDEGQRFLEQELRDGRIVDCGDVDVLYTNPEGTFANVTRAVRAILAAGAFPLVIGGDHAISFPVVRAYEQPLQVVHFDAHIDFSPFVHGVQFANTQPMRHIALLPQVTRIVQVGIRSLRNAEEDIVDSRSAGNDILSVTQCRRLGVPGFLELMGRGPTYVSIDIDALDMPLVPGCSSAEIGGFTYDELRGLLFGLARSTQVVGFDLVEVNPMVDVASDNTSLLAAQLIIEFLGRIRQPLTQAAHANSVAGSARDGAD